MCNITSKWCMIIILSAISTIHMYYYSYFMSFCRFSCTFCQTLHVWILFYFQDLIKKKILTQSTPYFDEFCFRIIKGGEGFTFKLVKVCENMEKCQNSRFMWMLQRREFYSILGKYYWKKFKLYKGLIQHKNHWGNDLEVVDSPSQSCIPLPFQWKRLVFLSFSAKQQPRLCISQWTMVYELLWHLS